MLAYRFYIRDNQVETPLYVEVEEPIGWDGVTFTMQRSDQFDGLENVYSDDLTFYGLAGDILLDAFNNYGFDALLDFKIEFYCDNILNTTIENVINMLTYKRVGNETTVATEESSFGRKFISRYETVIDFNDVNSIEGHPLTPLAPFSLGVHSKLIETTSIMKELGDEIDTAFNGHVPYFYSTISDLDGVNDVTSDNFDDIADNYILVNNSQFTYTINVVLTISLKSLAQIVKNGDHGNVNYNYSGGYTMYIQVTDDALPPNVITSLDIATIPATDSTVGLVNTFSRFFNLVMHPNQRLRIIYLDTHESDLPGSIIHRDNKYTYLPATQVNLKNDSKIIPSTCKAYLVYECFNRVCEAMTDQQDAFRSDFFGRINSSPKTYDTNGCAAWEAW